jgi:hypothetical protein
LRRAKDGGRSPSGVLEPRCNSGSIGLFLPATCPSHAASCKPVERGSSGSSPEAQ